MKVKFLLILIFCSVNIFSQVDTLINRSDLQNLLEDTSEEKDESNSYDILEYMSQNPILLNSASINDLARIPFLNLTSASAIIKHRNLLGGIYDVDQLRFIQGVSFETIEKILPFIKLGDEQPLSFNEIFDNKLSTMNLSFRSRAIYDIQTEQAFKDGKFPNSRMKLYNRFILDNPNKFRIGALIEKDPGEKKINDFSTFHFQFKDLDFIKNIVIGDYVFEFGQGLAMWSRYGFSKSTEAVEVLPRNARGLIPYLSADENQFLRGLSLVTNYKDFTLSTFFSSRFLDASVDSSTNLITALRIDGLHRTQSEIKKKHNVNEKLFGAALEYSLKDFGNIGFLIYHSTISNAFVHDDILTPIGNKFNYFSTSYNFGYGKINLNGETAFTKNSFATLNTAEIDVDKNFAILFSFRNYEEDFWNIHSNGFGERDFAQNETGFYTGARLKTIYGTFNFYFDQFKFYYVSDRFPFPAKGNDFLIYYSFKPVKNSELRIRYKNEKKETPNITNDVYSLIGIRFQNIRGEFIFSPFKNLQLRSRIDFVEVTPMYPKTKNEGYLIFQDVKFQPVNNISLSARVIFFKTDSYNSRVYEFENDLIGVMTNPALYGDGMRWYLLAKLQTSFGLTVSMKYSEIYKPNEINLGSGDSQIPGNLDNRISFQLDYRL